MDARGLKSCFKDEFGASPRIFRAPGRVNVIGEHTDYNDGFVLPSAIGFYTYAAIAPRNDRKLIIRSTGFSDGFTSNIGELPASRLGSWSDYPLGVIKMLQAAGVQLDGATLLLHGEVPIGSGLSSSAAVEVATALAVLSLSDRAMSLVEVAKLCQKAENEFVGARVGIMDQFVSCNGREGHALLLDCRSLNFELVPIPNKVKLVICNTMVKHALSGGEYNQRREQCEAGVRILSGFDGGIKALRDVSLEQLTKHKADLPDVVFRRCMHVVQEDQRTQETAKQFRAGDLNAIGRLMRESHISLRDLYEVSCRELDLMVEAAQGLPGFYGGRMTGGGFGGCTVNLVETTLAQAFALKIADRYQAKTGIVPQTYTCSPANGAEEVSQGD